MRLTHFKLEDGGRIEMRQEGETARLTVHSSGNQYASILFTDREWQEWLGRQGLDEVIARVMRTS